MWVSPFRDLRVMGYLLLAAAYRSLSRLSSALSAKASTLCSLYLDHSGNQCNTDYTGFDCIPHSVAGQTKHGWNQSDSFLKSSCFSFCISGYTSISIY